MTGQGAQEGSGRSSPAVRQRAGGRSDRVRRQVAEAALELVLDGRVAPTPAEVAARAGVHRTTVYRWWPTPADLLEEALTLHTARLAVPDTGSWPGDVRALFEELARFFSDPVEVAMNAAMAGGGDPGFDALQVEHWLPIVERLSEVVERAKRRGEIEAHADAGLVLRLVISPLIVSTLLLHEAPDADLLDGLGGAVARAFGSGHASPTRSSQPRGG